MPNEAKGVHVVQGLQENEKESNDELTQPGKHSY